MINRLQTAPVPLQPPPFSPDSIPGARAPCRIIMPPLLQHLVHVFQSSQLRHHHRPDGSSDPAERHHIRVNALIVHHHKAPRIPSGRDHRRHQRGSCQVRQDCAHTGTTTANSSSSLLRQRLTESSISVDSIVDRDNLRRLRQRFCSSLSFAFTA